MRDLPGYETRIHGSDSADARLITPGRPSWYSVRCQKNIIGASHVIEAAPSSFQNVRFDRIPVDNAAILYFERRTPGAV